MKLLLQMPQLVLRWLLLLRWLTQRRYCVGKGSLLQFGDMRMLNVVLQTVQILVSLVTIANGAHIWLLSIPLCLAQCILL